MNQELTSSFFKVNHLQLHAVQAGPADGPLVILLHGFPDYWRGWQGQIAPLADAGLRLLLPDQRGYNLSDKPGGVSSYKAELLAADVAALVRILGRKHVYLVGHDWGALVAWETTLRYPEMVDRLAILNVPHPSVMNRYLRKNPRQMLKSWYIFFFTIPRLPERLLSRKNYAGLRRALLSSGKPGTFSPQELDEYLQAWSQPGALTAMINWYRAAAQRSQPHSKHPGPHPPRLVAAPTLILWGKQDVALHHSMAQASLEYCPRGRLVTYENASHWVQRDEAQAVNQELVAFLTQPPAA